jgi:hypothetical protein
MSHSISTLLTRNLHDVFGENDPRVGARRLRRSSPKIACSTIPWEASPEAATRSIESRVWSGPLTLTFSGCVERAEPAVLLMSFNSDSVLRNCAGMNPQLH